MATRIRPSAATSTHGYHATPVHDQLACMESNPAASHAFDDSPESAMPMVPSDTATPERSP
jgi:hypothetical protein